jgi:predicted transcriptional regulator of viral defense system/very-short-patch-repair endonuclease
MHADQNRALAHLASQQYGVLSLADAKACGLSQRQITGLVARGEWERAALGVYRIAAAPMLDRTPLAIALAASGGMASHRSAAELHGERSFVPPLPDILLLGSSNFQGAATTHRTDLLRPEDRCIVAGLPCTSLARTLFDLGGVLSEFEVEGLVHRALAKRRVEHAHLVEQLHELAARGRNGTATMRAILKRLPAGAVPMESHVEVLLFKVLRAHDVRLPDRQVKVRVGGADHRLDFAYPVERIFLEGDGFGVHTEREMFESDRVRQNRLVIAGWLPLRYTDRMLRSRPYQIASEVQSFLRSRAAA